MRCTRICNRNCLSAGPQKNSTVSSTNGLKPLSSKACCASKKTCTCALHPARDISLLLNSGQNTLSAEELEDLCTMMAQRLSILHGLNAPEFFDKSLFRHFIQTLLEEDVLRRDANGKLSYHELLGELAEGAAKRVLPAEIRLSIRQVALHRSEDAADISESVG